MDPPSPPITPPPPPSDHTCNSKFLTMLRCVEATAATAACNRQINDFLACQHRILRAALSKSASPTQHSILYPHESMLPFVRRPHEESNDAPQQESDTTRMAPASVFRHVIEKQTAACVSMAELLARPNYSRDVATFGKRMIADVWLTFGAIGAFGGQMTQRVYAMIKGDEDSSRN